MHMLGTELGLMEMTEVEHTHSQHLIQAHMEAQAGPPGRPDARPHPAIAVVKDAAASTLVSPITISQAIDLSTSTDEHCLAMPGEKTPASYGDVPGYVLAKIRGEDSPNSNSDASSQKRSTSAARVCLEKRFNTMSADTQNPQDIQSTVLSNFMTMIQQSAEAQEAGVHPQMQKWMKTDRANPFEVIGHIPHLIEPSKHHGLILPKSFSFNFHPATNAQYMSSSNPIEEQHLVNIQSEAVTIAASMKHDHAHNSQPTEFAKAATDSCGLAGNSTRKKARPCTSLSQRRERHNSKERERRKRIRLCCDELNKLVPFCDSDTDKVTTLQWTTAYLRYINKTYGDTFKVEFQKSLTEEKRVILKPSISSGQDTQKVDEIVCMPLAEQ